MSLSPAILILSSFAFGAAIMAILNQLASRSWRRSASYHWAERARLLQTVRFSAGLNMFTIPATAALVFWLLSQDGGALWPLYALAAFLGVLIGCYPLDKRILPEFTFRKWAAQASVVWGLRLLLALPFLLTLHYMPNHWGWEIPFILSLYLLWHVWVVTIGGEQILKLLRVVRLAPPAYVEMLQPCFVKIGVTPNHLWTLKSPYPLAFAFPFGRNLLFTEGCFEKCNPGEIRAICLHELAHLRETKGALFARILGSCKYFPLLLLSPAISSWGFGAFIVLYFAVLGITFLNQRLSQKLERDADQIAVSGQEDEAVYARTLEKLHMLNQIPAVMPGKSQSHPHLYDRMIAAGVQPEFERPQPPVQVGWSAALPLFIALALFIIVFIAQREGITIR